MYAGCIAMPKIYNRHIWLPVSAVQVISGIYFYFSLQPWLKVIEHFDAFDFGRQETECSFPAAYLCNPYVLDRAADKFYAVVFHHLVLLDSEENKAYAGAYHYEYDEYYQPPIF